jgi:hypothetical protein
MSLFEAYRRELEEAKTSDRRSRFLGALGNFRRPEVREAALAYARTFPLRPLGSPSPGRAVHDPGHLAFADEDGAERAVRWLEESFDLLAEKVPPQLLSGTAHFGQGCSRERLGRVRTLLLARQVPGAEERLQRVADDVEACIALREREGEAVASWLASRP